MAQTCEREIARLNAAKELSKADELKREAAVAVAIAAESLSSLLHAETLKQKKTSGVRSAGSFERRAASQLAFK